MLSRITLVGFLVTLLYATALAQEILDCASTLSGCEIGPVTISNPAVLTYEWNTSASFTGGVYVILRSATGNADLYNLTTPSGAFLSSAFNSGEDRIYAPVPPSLSEAGTWKLMVTSVTRTSSFYLTIRAVRDIPSLNADDTKALELFKKQCCAGSGSNACRRITTTSNICASPYMYCDPETGALLSLNLAGASNSDSGGPASTQAPFTCPEAPTSLGKFTALETVDLTYLRGVTWTLQGIAYVVAPSTIKRLYLSGNKISGELPCSLFTGTGNGSALQSLWLQDNPITGTVPDCIFTQNLVDLSLARNSLTGALPDTIPPSSKLQMLQIDSQFTGMVPSLAGTIPSSIKNAENLFLLSLGYNNITGTIPVMPPSLESLWLLYNSITGSLPSHLLDLPKLLTVWVAGNQLSGSLPPGWGSKKGLQELFISSNKLSGNIDFDWSGNPELSVLRASLNQFTGTVPPSLAKVPSLAMLRLQNNVLTSIDEFAAALDTTNHITAFNVSTNAFKGPLPEGLGNLGVFSKPQFNEIHTGTIVTWNRTFDVTNNSFEGEFPEWVLQKLQDLSKQSFYRADTFELRLTTNGSDGNRFYCPTGFSGSALSANSDESLSAIGKSFGLKCTMQSDKSVVPISSVIKANSASKKSSKKPAWWAILLAVLVVLIAVAAIAAGVVYTLRVLRKRKAASFSAYKPGVDTQPMHGAIHHKVGDMDGNKVGDVEMNGTTQQ